VCKWRWAEFEAELEAELEAERGELSTRRESELGARMQAMGRLRPCNCHRLVEERARQHLLTYRIVGALLVVLLRYLEHREIVEDHVCAQVAHTAVQLFELVVAAAAAAL